MNSIGMSDSRARYLREEQTRLFVEGSGKLGSGGRGMPPGELAHHEVIRDTEVSSRHFPSGLRKYRGGLRDDEIGVFEGDKRDGLKMPSLTAIEDDSMVDEETAQESSATGTVGSPDVVVRQGQQEYPQSLKTKQTDLLKSPNTEYNRGRK